VNQGYFLAIAGNIGVGKTELTTRLSAELGWMAYYEPVIQNPYLDDFYADMSRWSFHLQVYFLSERFKAQVQIGSSPLPFIQDRTIYEDAEIFAQSLAKRRLIDARDWRTYQELYETLTRELKPPDLMIYLKCSTPSLMKRIAKRGRKSEEDIPRAYVARLNVLYEEWFARYDRSPTLVLPSDRMDYVTDLFDRQDLLSTISRYL